MIHANELFVGLKQSKLDKDSIPYHLIEFMCNLYDCQNWKEIEEIAEAYETRIMAAAMKDLPRWRKCAPLDIDGSTPPAWIVRFDAEREGNESKIVHNGYYIDFGSLERLPGFNE